MKVTQEDREAARRLCGLPSDPAFIDSDRAVQAFAAHREAAEARVVEWLRTSHVGAALPGIADAIARGEHLKG